MNESMIEIELLRKKKSSLLMAIFYLAFSILILIFLREKFFESVPYIKDKTVQFKQIVAVTPTEIKLKDSLLRTSHALLGSAYFVGRILYLGLSFVFMVCAINCFWNFLFCKKLLEMVRNQKR